MLCVLLALVNGHVPIFGNGCAIEPATSDLSISQVRYFRGEKGVVNAVTFPSSTATAVVNSEKGMLVDITLQDPKDIVDFEVFVGCLRNSSEVERVCNSNTLPQSTPISVIKTGIEPFTQYRYSTVLNSEITSHLGGCDSTTGTYFIGGKSTNSTVKWGVVIGRGESFTFEELFMFPLFINYLHGSYGNGLYRFHLLSVTTLLLSIPYIYSRTIQDPGDHILSDRVSVISDVGLQARSTILSKVTNAMGSFSIVVFALVSFDMLQHYIDCVNLTSSSGGLGLFIGVIVSANLLPAVSVYMLMTNNSHRVTMVSMISVIILSVLYSISLGFLSTTATIVYVSFWNILGILYCGVVVYMGGEFIKCFPVTLMCWHMILFIFLGSGYWIGPLSGILFGGLYMWNISSSVVENNQNT